MWPFGGEEEKSISTPDAKGADAMEQPESWVPDLGIESTIGWMMGSTTPEESAEVAGVQAELDAILQKQIHFHGGKSEIADGSMSTVQAIADVLLREPEMRVIIEGHTDSNNQPLSQKRAEAVATCLRQLGVYSSRVEARGFGNRYPLASGNSKRVEIKVIGSPSSKSFIPKPLVEKIETPATEEKSKPEPFRKPDLTVVMDSFCWEGYVFYHTTELAPPKSIVIAIPTDRVRLVEVIIKSCMKSYLLDIPAGCGGSKIEAHFRRASAAGDFSLVFSSKFWSDETWGISLPKSSQHPKAAKYRSIAVADTNAYLVNLDPLPLPVKESTQNKSKTSSVNESYLRYVLLPRTPIQTELRIPEQKPMLEEKNNFPLPLTDPKDLPAVQEVPEEVPEEATEPPKPTKPQPVAGASPGPSFLRCALAAGFLATVGFGAHYLGQTLRVKSTPV